MKLGGIEAGGTKMVCAIGDEQGNSLRQGSIPYGDTGEYGAENDGVFSG